MPNEIEHKFLVNSPPLAEAIRVYKISQGYLSSVPERTVRVRLRDKQGYLTIKGIGDATGLERPEFEKRIRYTEAEGLMELVEPGAIIKQRYLIRENPDDTRLKVFFRWLLTGKKSLYFEIDVFEGENEGLVLAEIELGFKGQPFRRPSWLGKEVTGDSRYYNSALTKRPYSRWSKEERLA